MGTDEYLRGLSGADSGRKTRNVNVFDQTERKIKCIEKTHDYLGDGNPITEEDLEIGKLYTFIGGSAESYGNMVYLEELPSKYGYQSYLFEEQFEYDEAIILQEQENWLHNELQKGENDIRCGRTYPAEEVFEKLRSEIRLIEIEQEKKYMGSRLLYCIKHNPDNWEQEINDRLIRTSHKGNLVCFKYGIEADFSDPLVCEARGIIIDVKHQTVVCRPFDKFFNVQEQYAADIDWNTAKVLEKIDGSLIKLYWYNGKWTFATSSTCDATEASVAGYKGVTYRDIIARADNYSRIPFDDLNKNRTYLFELVSPMTQVVIRYDKTSLYYLASFDNMTGEEVDVDLFEEFKRPRSYPLKTIDECISAAMELNRDSEEDIKDEGFVVVDGQHRRIKIKSPAYIALHRAVTNKVFTVKRITELYQQGADLVKLAKDFPGEAHIIKYYDWQFEEVRHNINEMAGYARALYEEYDHDRRAVASEIKDSPYAWAGFAAIGNDKSVEELMQVLSHSKLEKLITEYCYG
jgi:T4 RnlA family RNA ligase